MAAPAGQATPAAFVRVNQVGYMADQPKQAIVLSSEPWSGSFSVIDCVTGLAALTAPIPAASQRPWNLAYPNTYQLDFSTVTTESTYFIQLTGGAVSPVFRVGSAVQLYAGCLSHVLFYFQAQRDGPDVITSVLSRRPSHLADETASVYAQPVYSPKDFLASPLRPVAGPVDVSGGRFDAGDYVKFVETASYVEGLMLFALREHPAVLSSHGDWTRECRFGLDWLFKMWDQDSQTLYYQVGLTDGDSAGTIGSDHDLWRLPEMDDLLGESMPSQFYFYVKHRPVFRAGRGRGDLISPNLAGRMAAAFALGAQVFHESDPAYARRCLLAAQTVFDLAKTRRVGRLLTTSPYDNYPETEWRDDLEWAAAELYFATSLPSSLGGLPHSDPVFYLQQSAYWAQNYIASRNHLQDSLNLYDVSALAHYELAHALSQANISSGLAVHPADLINDLNAQLAQGSFQMARDPFRLGLAYDASDIVPHALGYAVTAHLFQRLTGAHDYDRFGQQQRDWVLGMNAWGTSFIIGAGSTFPLWPQHQVANLAGAHDGTAPILLGAVVDGPAPAAELAELEALDGMIPTPPGLDRFASFRTTGGITYVDNVIDWPTVEPANDYTIISLLLFASEMSDP